MRLLLLLYFLYYHQACGLPWDTHTHTQRPKHCCDSFNDGCCCLDRTEAVSVHRVDPLLCTIAHSECLPVQTRSVSRLSLLQGVTVITKCHEKVLCYHIIYLYKVYFVMYVLLLYWSQSRLCVSWVCGCVCALGVFGGGEGEEERSRRGATGCAEVHEPLCGSSDTVCSPCYTEKTKSLLSSVFHQLDSVCWCNNVLNDAQHNVFWFFANSMAAMTFIHSFMSEMKLVGIIYIYIYEAPHQLILMGFAAKCTTCSTCICESDCRHIRTCQDALCCGNKNIVVSANLLETCCRCQRWCPSSAEKTKSFFFFFRDAPSAAKRPLVT